MKSMKGDVAPMKRTILTLTMVLASSICSQSFGFDLLDRMLSMNGSGSSASCCDTGCEPVCGAEAPCGACGNSGCDGCGNGGLFGGGSARGLANPCGGCGSCGDCMTDPTCGLEAACGACGSSACNGGCFGDPTCGLEAACGGCDSCLGGNGGGLLSRLFGGGGCDAGCGTPCEPTCGIGTGVAAPGMAVESPACGCADPVCGCEAVGAFGDACGNACDSPCGGRSGGLLSKLFGHRGHGCDTGCDSGCGSCDGGYQGAPYQGGTIMPAPVDEQAAPMPPEPVVDPSASVTSKRRVIQASAVYVR